MTLIPLLRRPRQVTLKIYTEHGESVLLRPLAPCGIIGGVAGGVAGGPDACGKGGFLRRSRHPERNSGRNRSLGEGVRGLLGGSGTRLRPPRIPGECAQARRFVNRLGF